jgi:hypothetical protein
VFLAMKSSAALKPWAAEYPDRKSVNVSVSACIAGEDSVCESCRRGDTVNCQNPVTSGVTTDGGYAELMIAEARGISSVPDELTSAKAAPLLCAGITTYNALRNAGLRGGDLVAVQGIGGLGHLGVRLRGTSDSVPSQSGADATRKSWRRTWVRTPTSTLPLRMLPRHCSGWAGRERFLRPAPVVKLWDHLCPALQPAEN